MTLRSVERPTARRGARTLDRKHVRYSGSDSCGQNAAFFRHVIEASPTPIAVLQCSADDQSIVYVNPAFERCLGYAAHDIVGCDWRVICDADENELTRIRAAIEAGEETRVTLRNAAVDARSVWYELHVAALRDGRESHDQRVAVLRDITAERGYLQEIEQRADHDALTGLPNRHLLQDRIEQSLAHARRSGESFGVAMVDLDGFKPINDMLGHDAGDELLRKVAARLTRSLRGEDTVARLGGDEFVLVLNSVKGPESIQQVIRRLADEVQQPMCVYGNELTVSCSIGVSLYPDDGLDQATLLRNADRAMYESKARSRGTRVSR